MRENWQDSSYSPVMGTGGSARKISILTIKEIVEAWKNTQRGRGGWGREKRSCCPSAAAPLSFYVLASAHSHMYNCSQ